MVRIEAPLRRLKDRVNRLVVPSAALRDVRTLEAQVELRRQALRDIEVIRCRLRPFMCRKSKSLTRRPRNGRANGSGLVGSLQRSRAG